MPEWLQLLSTGLGIVISWKYIGFIFAGVCIGMIVGALPGISGVMTIILLLPFTYYLELTQALLLLIAVFCASTYGGSITAILFNIPGDPQNACTCFDGYPMTRKGQAASALGHAITASAIGGIFGALVLIVAAPPIANIALSFSTVEYFSLAVLGLVTVSALGSDSPARGFASLTLGMLLATVGISPIEGTIRFTFGIPFLQGGVDFIAVMIGVFALSEILYQSATNELVPKVQSHISASLPSFAEIRRLSGTIFRSSVIGTLIGALPGAGATIASFVSYSVARRLSPNPERFGSGEPVGVVAPESANNAATGGVMIPLFTLGIPGGAATAIMLGVFYLHGLQPGPLVFLGHKDMIAAVFVGMLITNLMILFLGFLAVRLFVRVLLVPYSILATLISVLCILGSFGIRNNINDVWVTLITAILGLAMRWLGYPIAPLVLGLVLGPLAETKFLASMEAHHDNLLVFFFRPMSASILFLALLLLAAPLLDLAIQHIRSRKRHSAAGRMKE